MKLPKLDNADIAGKKVLVRADLDVGGKGADLIRLKALIPTLDYLSSKKCKIILMGHRGRPKGKAVNNLSLKSVSDSLKEILTDEWGKDRMKTLDMNMMENLRFKEGEEGNDKTYAKHIAEHGEFYVNEAFAASHREHASIVTLPKLMPSAFGFRFVEEVEKLSEVKEEPKHPLLLILGGIKKDKLNYLDDFKGFADKVLVAGRLPEYLPEDNKDPKLVIAKLLPDKEDITLHSIEDFEEEIARAKMIILTGPAGKYEEEGHRMGTQRVFNAVVKSKATKIAGGGDTLRALVTLNLQEKFDWVSVGGGATLEFLAKGTLPGIDALVN
jgi:phosphoglycerate kinase